MTTDEMAETLTELTACAARLAELRLRVLTTAERSTLAADAGQANTAAWLANATRVTRGEAHRDVDLALALDRPVLEPTRAALAAGEIGVDQARVIVHAVEDLDAVAALPEAREAAEAAEAAAAAATDQADSADQPSVAADCPDEPSLDEISDEDRTKAQAHLLDLASVLDARRLRTAGRRVFEVLAPEQADAREGVLLGGEERAARAGSVFGMRNNGEGSWSGWFRLPEVQALMLAKAVQAFAAPRRTSPDAWVDAQGKRVPYRTQLGQAFGELVEHLPTDRLPQHGGVNAQCVVTMEMDTLRDGLKAASLDGVDAAGGAKLSPGQTRRLACTAGLVPAVLGGRSAVLDLGVTVRFFNAAQRTAMGIRDKGCTAVGCDRPAAWCEAHHDPPMSEGGRTDLAKGRLLCPRHHHMAHDAGYAMRPQPDGKVSFHRQT
jgi:hypothetical protein